MLALRVNRVAMVARLMTFTALALVSKAGATVPKQIPKEQLFPAKLSEAVLQELLAAGRVKERPSGLLSDDWNRWGGGAPEHQEAALRAVIGALTIERPPLSLGAAILAIARVESGFNPDSENPHSTACGIFQFVKATWEAYGSPRELCFDPQINSQVGVRHLLSLYRNHVRDSVPCLAPTADESARADRIEQEYTLLYAYHYHGEASEWAADGGSPEAHEVAQNGLPYLKSFLSILEKATREPVRKRPPVVVVARHRRRARVRPYAGA